MERGHLVGRVHRRELPPRRLPRPGPALRAGPGVPATPPGSCSTPGAATRSSPTRTAGAFLRRRRRRARSRTTTRSSTSHGQFNVPAQPAGPAGDLPGRRLRRGPGVRRRDRRRDLHPARHARRRARRSTPTSRAGWPSTAGDRDELLILPAATFVLGDTDAEAAGASPARSGAQQVSRQTAIKFARAAVEPGPVRPTTRTARCPTVDPVVGENTIAKGRASVRMYADPVAIANEWRALAEAKGPVDPRAGDRGDRPAVVRRHRRQTVAEHDRRLRPGRRQRRLHPGPAHHPGRARRVRRQGRAAAAGARRVPHRLRGHDAARPPRARPAGRAGRSDRRRVAS